MRYGRTVCARVGLAFVPIHGNSGTAKRRKALLMRPSDPSCERGEPMTSDLQPTARPAASGARSRGSRTAAGKVRSSRNALRHGSPARGTGPSAGRPPVAAAPATKRTRESGQ